MLHLIVGLARSGKAASRYLLRQGASREEIRFFDDKVKEADFSHPDQLPPFSEIEQIVVSPGYPLSTPWLKEAEKQGVSLTSELALGFSSLTGENLVGITGSVGKSTCSALLAAGAKAAFGDVFLGGNFGTPLCEYVCDVLEGRRRPCDWLILELSSFQLENPGSLRLQAGLITHLSANHLERYPNLESYYETKWSLVERTSGPMVLNRHGGDLWAFASNKRGEWIWSSPEDPGLTELLLEEAQLIGRHNLENLAAVTTLARALDWPREAIEEMKQFRGLPHRLQNLGAKRGVSFINDSKATSLESVLIAAEAARQLVRGGGHLIHLIGGRDKNLPWEKLQGLGRDEKHLSVFFGEACEQIASRSGLKGVSHPRLASALKSIEQILKPGDVVLLSPGGTSLDEFKNFEERGDSFSDWVSRL